MLFKKLQLGHTKANTLPTRHQEGREKLKIDRKTSSKAFHINLTLLIGVCVREKEGRENLL